MAREAYFSPSRERTEIKQPPLPKCCSGVVTRPPTSVIADDNAPVQAARLCALGSAYQVRKVMTDRNTNLSAELAAFQR